MVESILGLIGFGTCIGIAWMMLRSHQSSKVLGQELLARVAAMDGGSTPTPMDQISVFLPMIGGPGRRKAPVYLGMNYLFMYLPMPGQSDFVQIAWDYVLDVFLSEPELPQLAPTNFAAMLANAATRAEYGKDVVVTIYENGQKGDLVFGGLLGRAADMANLISQKMRDASLHIA